jgi:hypothetical protein
MLVDTPARLLPGHYVDLVLLGGASQEVRRCCIVHSRVAAIDGVTGPRYRAGLRLTSGSLYPDPNTTQGDGKELPTDPCVVVANTIEIGGNAGRDETGTQLGKRDSV